MGFSFTQPALQGLALATATIAVSRNGHVSDSRGKLVGRAPTHMRDPTRRHPVRAAESGFLGSTKSRIDRRTTTQRIAPPPH